MKTAMIIHGRPKKDQYYREDRASQSNSHWLPWLQHQLLIRDILAQALEFPRPYEPSYEEWREMFEKFMPDEETTLVGMSYGAGFILRWLSENKDKKVGRVVLVAPSLGYGLEDKDVFFGGFKIDENMTNRTNGVTIVTAKNDFEDARKAARELAETIKGIKVRELETGGHFLFKDMGTKEFPELLEEVLL